MNAARAPYKTREPGSLKDAVTQLVMACGGQRKAAGLTRVSPGQIARYTDDSDEVADVNLPVDIQLALEIYCGQPIVTRYIAAAQGRALLDLVLPTGNVKPAETLAGIAEGTGKLLADAMRAIDHDRFDAKKAGKVRQVAYAAMAAIAALVQALPGEAP